MRHKLINVKRSICRFHHYDVIITPSEITSAASPVCAVSRDTSQPNDRTMASGGDAFLLPAKTGSERTPGECDRQAPRMRSAGKEIELQRATPVWLRVEEEEEKEVKEGRLGRGRETVKGRRERGRSEG